MSIYLNRRVFVMEKDFAPSGVYSIRKESAPTGSEFFPYRVVSFSEGDKTIWTELPPLKVYLNSLNNGANTNIYIAEMRCTMPSEK